MMSKYLVAGMLLGGAACAPTTVSTSAAPSMTGNTLAPLNSAPDGWNAAEGHYIVRFTDEHCLEDHLKFIGIDLDFTAKSDNGNNGYSAEVNATIVDELIRRDPGVKYVEQVHYGQLIQNTLQPLDQSNLTTRDTQYGTGWNLAYMAQNGPNPTPEDQYPYAPNGGKGVDVYVMDSGVLTNHNDLEGRASVPYPSADTKFNFRDSPATDDKDHGTGVASVVAGKLFGVAKKANIISIKISDCKGAPHYKCDLEEPSINNVLKAVDWVTAQHKSKTVGKNGYNGAVLTMSVSFGYSDTLDEALNKAAESGIKLFAAAGNGNLVVSNANKVYPCQHRKVRCVGGINKNYQRYQLNPKSGSNFGEVIAWVAPGQDVGSASSAHADSITQATGTSIATPHMAGVAAIIMSFYPGMILDDFWRKMRELSEKDLAEDFGKKQKPPIGNTGYRKKGGPGT